MKQQYQKPSIMKDTLIHFESIYTASGAPTPTIPIPTPSIAPPDCNGGHHGGHGHHHGGNNNGHHHGGGRC